MSTIAERYLNAVADRDWTTAHECLAEDVKRIGPLGEGDTYDGRERYLAYLAQVMLTLLDYRMHIERAVSSEDGRSVTVELTEHMEIDGKKIRNPECLIFDLDTEGLIQRIAIYIQRW
jgi:ketosteroid isomerase-like protein